MTVGALKDAGAIFCAEWCADNPLYLAVGGSAGQPKLWDALSAPAVAARFAERAPQFFSRQAVDLSNLGLYD